MLTWLFLFLKNPLQGNVMAGIMNQKKFVSHLEKLFLHEKKWTFAGI